MPKKRAVAYTHELFKQAAIEWLVSTDQVIFLYPHSSFSYIWLSKPIDALAYPKFREMIDIASCAPDGINIPSRKQTRAEILNTFKTHLIQLRKRLNVSLIYYLVPPLSNQYFYYKPGLQSPASAWLTALGAHGLAWIVDKP